MNLKILKFYFRAFYNYFFFVFNLYIKLIEKRTIISKLKKDLLHSKKILTFLQTSNIGGCSLMYLSILEYAEKNNIDLNDIIVFVDDNNSNDFLIKKINQKLKFIQDKKIFNLLYNDFLIVYFEKINLGFKPLINYVNFNITNRYIKFNSEDRANFRLICNKVKLDLNKKIVAIGFKNNDYHSKKYNRNYDFENYRVSSHKNLINPIKHLRQLGYQIVLLGFYNKRIINELSENIVNIKSLTKSELEIFDIMIFEYLDFALLGNYGMRSVASLFDTPVIHFNGIYIHYNNEKSLYLPKIFYSKKLKRPLKLCEINKLNYFEFDPLQHRKSFFINRNIMYSRSIEIFDYFQIDLIENNDDEIIYAVNEMIDLLNNKTNQQFLINNSFEQIFENFKFSSDRRDFKLYGFFSKASIKANPNFLDDQ